MLNHMQMKSRPRASRFQIDNVRQWLDNANGPIATDEVAFVQEENQEDDLIPVVSREKAPLRKLANNFKLCRILACFRERDASASSDCFLHEKMLIRFSRGIDACSDTRILRCRPLFTKRTQCWTRS